MVWPKAKTNKISITLTKIACKSLMNESKRAERVIFQENQSKFPQVCFLCFSFVYVTKQLFCISFDNTVFNKSNRSIGIPTYGYTHARFLARRKKHKKRVYEWTRARHVYVICTGIFFLFLPSAVSCRIHTRWLLNHTNAETQSSYNARASAYHIKS